MSEEKKAQQQIKINFPKELVGGAYANNLMIQHNRDEFILDFMMIAPPAGTVVSRILSSPGQVKRIVRALEENIEKYEKRFGEIAVPEAPAVQYDINPHTKQ